MFNITLFLLLFAYIISLLIGFNLKKHQKDITNLRYQNYRFFLLLLIILIFILTSTLLLVISSFLPWFNYILVINGIFIIYFIFKVDSQTRCWKQHRMVFYNFISIPIIYLSSLLLEQPLLLISVLVIYLYTITEFQFAKFNPKKPLIWD